MSYKCTVCGLNEVEYPGGICEMCSLEEDPYAMTLSNSKKNFVENDSFVENSNISSDESIGNQVNIYTPKRSNPRKILLNGGHSFPGQDPCSKQRIDLDFQNSEETYNAKSVSSPTMIVAKPTNQNTEDKNRSVSRPLVSGITKNIVVDHQTTSFIGKWVHALFTGVPFLLDDEILMFQVFPDYSGSALNALGNVCDQVIVYGQLKKGAISENNEVEIYGHRDSDNNIIAKVIKNKATGTVVHPKRKIETGAVWLITVVVLFLMSTAIIKLGLKGIVWGLVLLICLVNISIVLKIFGLILGLFISILKSLFRRKGR